MVIKLLLQLTFLLYYIYPGELNEWILYNLISLSLNKVIKKWNLFISPNQLKYLENIL